MTVAAVISRRPGRTLGIFHKRIEGDDGLLELARQRFEQAKMGPEFYADTPDELDWLMKFAPRDGAMGVVHLSREYDLADATSRNRMREFASRFAGRVYGMVVHDRPAVATAPGVYVDAARQMDSLLSSISESPLLFVEFAGGVSPAQFLEFAAGLGHLGHIGVCLDVGHVGIWQTRQAYFRKHPDVDVCTLKSDPARLPQLLPEIEDAVASALPVVEETTRAVVAFGKPVHFHLHDGHPLSTFSPFGVSDHLSFLEQIPLAFEHRGQRRVPLMFGAEGLGKIVAAALSAGDPSQVSLTLEIHPTFGRLPLGDAVPLFSHWRDKTHAEQMNHWLGVLVQNHALLQQKLSGNRSFSLTSREF